ncbi:MAG: ParB/RepB/Spo0J family partition protein [Verrucomicrobiota bacterium]
MNTTPIEGFWAHPQGISKGVYHFFIDDTQESICGKWRLREMREEREIRKHGNEDCLKCIDIHRELFAIDLTPKVQEPAWTVETDILGEGAHILYYQGKEQSRTRGAAGLATQKELAALLNKNGSVPKGKKKIKCAADAPSAAKFLEAKSKQSPELPLIEEKAETLKSTTTKPTPNNPMPATAKAKALTPPPVDVATGQVQEFPANQFHRAEENRVISPGQIEKMSGSIRQVGVLQPITARWVTDPVGANDESPKLLEIVLGECRWRGCLDIDENYPVPCFVRNLTDKDAAMIRAIENFQRKDLDEVEEARAIHNLQETGWTMQDICENLGREKSGVYQRLALLKLNDEAHQALRDKNISINTAVKLASLPDEQRADALKAVVSPTHSAKALPEREALQLLDRQFVEPAKVAAEWEKRREAILENYPGAKWSSYEAARKLGVWNSGYEEVDDQPSHDILSDAARAEELVVPTWGELAKKHGAELVIGCNYSNEAIAFVLIEPLIDAEKVACNENPADCIFLHEDAVHQAREDAERRKLEEEQRREAVKQRNNFLTDERKKLAALILSPDGVTKTAIKKFVERCHLDCIETVYLELDELGKLFDLPEPASYDERDEWKVRVEAALAKYLKSKSFGPLEAMGRVFLAGYALSANCSYAEMFETGVAKPAEFPASQECYQEQLAKIAKRAAEDAASAAETEFAEGEPESNREEEAE